MHSRKTYILIVLAWIFLILSGCNAKEKKTFNSKPLSFNAWLPLKLGRKDIQAQIAITTEEQQRGLMHRRELKANHGMIFVYTAPDKRRFWMRNTLIPLDIGFFTSDGVLYEVHKMYPHDETPIRSSKNNIQYCLEMNQGWFKRNNIFPGEKLDMELLKLQISKRGADPSLY